MKRILHFILKKKTPTEKVGFVLAIAGLCILTHGVSHLLGIPEMDNEHWIPICEYIRCPF